MKFNYYRLIMSASLNSLICGPFSKGIKCQVYFKYNRLELKIFFQLEEIKSTACGKLLVVILFFVTEKEKFVVVSSNTEIGDTLALKKTYFLKNVSKKVLPSNKTANLFEAIEDTQIKPSKNSITTVSRYIFRENINLSNLNISLAFQVLTLMKLKVFLNLKKLRYILHH